MNSFIYLQNLQNLEARSQLAKIIYYFFPLIQTCKQISEEIYIERKRH